MKDLRESRGLTQEQARKLLGVSKSSLSTYERSVREPNFETLIRMANLYHTTTDHLLCRDDRPVIYLSDFSDSQANTILSIFNALEKEFKNNSDE